MRVGRAFGKFIRIKTIWRGNSYLAGREARGQAAWKGTAESSTTRMSSDTIAASAT